jgi:hypothetical protein
LFVESEGGITAVKSLMIYVEALILFIMYPLNLTSRHGGYVCLSAILTFIYLFLPASLHAQKKSDVIPILECVEYIGNGKLNATFGYDNQNKESVSVTQSNSLVIIGSSKSNAITSFKPGRQYSVFKKEFNEKEVVIWNVILPNGKQKQVIASANSSLCKSGNSTPGNILPYYPPPTEGKTNTPIGSELTSLHTRYTTDPDSLTSGNVYSDDIYQVFNGHVLIEIIAEKETLTQLRSILVSPEYGFNGEVPNGPGSPIITGLYPIVNLLKLNDLDLYIRFVRPVYLPLANTGITTTQGDLSQRSDIARTGFNLDGSNIKVGVISDSYNTRVGNEAATDILNSDLPAGVHLVKEYPYGSRSDEGRAMMQLVHDVAPGADLAFRTGFISPGDLALGIHQMKDAGCDVIVDDITYITEPYLVDGKVAEAVDAVAAAGVSYFSSAGNFGSKSYQKVFTPVPAPSGFSGSAHNFGNGDVFQKIALTAGVYTIVLQWQDSFYTLGDTSTGTENDVDIFLTNEAGQILFGFNRNNIGGDPIEVLPFTVVGGNAIANIVITKVSGTSNPLLKYVVFRGDVLIGEYNTSSSTIVGQANAAGAMTVGAVLYSNTPRFGVNPPTIASFSSTGGTPVNGVNRNKPDFTAPNGGNTTVPLGGVNIDGDAFPNFFGTSASAPHAAGAAALLLHAREKFYGQSILPTTVRNILQNTSINMGVPGYDAATGFGFIQTDNAIATFAMPSPRITKMTVPSGITPGQSVFKVVVEGEFLNVTSVVYLKGIPLPTTLLSSTKVEAIVPVFGGNPPLQIYNPPITPSGLDGGFSNALYFFPKTKITIQADNKTKLYGQTLPDLTATVTSLMGSVQEFLHPITFQTPATSISNVGNYVIIPHTSFLDSLTAEFFEIEFLNGILIIQPIELVIQPNDLTIGYGAKIPEISFQYHYSDSLIEQKGIILDSLVSTHESMIAKNIVALVTDQPIANGGISGGKALVNTGFLATSNTVSGGKALVNGTIITNVDAASLLDSAALVNGSALVNGTAVVGGKALVNGTTVVGGKALVNGAESIVNSETINEENNSGVIVIVSESDSLVSGLVGISLITDTLAGNHWIVPAALLTKNFHVSYALGHLTILPGTLTITADNKIIKVGDALPVFTSTIAGFVNKETPQTVLAGPVLYALQPVYAGAGSYAIVPSATLKQPQNYSAVFQNGTLYVNPFGVGTKAVRPFLYCVEELSAPVEGFHYVAHFGYKNMNAIPVAVPLGSENFIQSEGSYYGNPPAVFAPGEGTFDIYFDGYKLNWVVKSMESTKKTAMASVASSSSNRCNRYERATGLAVEALYPNPVSDILKVLINDIPQQVSASFYNELTAKNYNAKSSTGQFANEIQIGVQNLPPGLYYLKLLVNNKIFSFRIVKE